MVAKLLMDKKKNKPLQGQMQGTVSKWLYSCNET